ncbi:nuclear egress lamina protein [Falconid herpesvirus 1]|uniref:Nuclear egress lamina protein n=2 Tax=Columbid alphaherpesvirus 1 TaxID=93386 RepID=A0A068ES15_9ALPH|nr:nuclear egress lamina protein [Falconid herpesvirus 1]YP_009352939.1 nuclear egress lamina protein [Columbid alphaherpesvirus 1]AID52735.1 nuclear egress lamina protein [Falconid herpesvirus 1]ARD71356.1 nuclear egress lamina protein [Columbid alphaherpesvirus 1]
MYNADDIEDVSDQRARIGRRLSSARYRRASGCNGLGQGPPTRRKWREMQRRNSQLRRRSSLGLLTRDRDAYKAYFELIAESPSEELTIVKDLTAPLIKTMPVTLPFDLSQAVADNCLSLSGMGYNLGVGSCCPTCATRGEPRLGRNDRAALILAYVQQINNIYHYRAFLASIVALGSRVSEEPRETENILSRVMASPELFFAYYVLRDAGVKDPRVLFYPDQECADGGYMMYVVFPGKAVHLHYRLLDCLKSACRGYRILAHVWQTAFVLVIRKECDKTIDPEGVPSVNAEDIYCKLCDLNIDGELLLEYGKLYSTFDDFLPPR